MKEGFNKVYVGNLPPMKDFEILELLTEYGYLELNVDSSKHLNLRQPPKLTVNAIANSQQLNRLTTASIALTA